MMPSRVCGLRLDNSLCAAIMATRNKRDVRIVTMYYCIVKSLYKHIIICLYTPLLFQGFISVISPGKDHLSELIAPNEKCDLVDLTMCRNAFFYDTYYS